MACTVSDQLFEALHGVGGVVHEDAHQRAQSGGLSNENNKPNGLDC